MLNSGNTPPSMQLWDDLHSTLTSITNKIIPSKQKGPEIISLGSTKNSNALLDKETELFRNIGNQVNLLIEKCFLTSSTYSESPSNFLINPTLRIFLMWSQTIIPPNTIQNNSTLLTNTTNKILPLLHRVTQTGRPHESHYSE